MAGFAAHDHGVRGRALTRPAPIAELRPAGRDELGAVAGLFAPALAGYRGKGADWILDAYLADLLDVRGRFDVAETYVARLDRRVVGSVAFYRDVVLEGWSNLPAGWAGFRALAGEFLASPALMFLSGVITMPAGLAIVLAHNVWTPDWRIVITVLGWLALLGGALRIIAPQRTAAFGRRMMDHPITPCVSAAIYLALGVLLCYFGYARR